MTEILFYEEPERQIKYQQTDLYKKGNFLDKGTFSFVKPQTIKFYYKKDLLLLAKNVKMS